MKHLYGLGAVAAMVLAGTSYGQSQVIVNEQFNYADQAALDANWNLGLNNTLTLSVGGGGASIPGTGTNPNIWDGTTFSLTPTDANPILLTADITSSGTAGSVGTVGLRTGANPLFEMGVYRVFDNIQTGTSSSTAITPSQTGIGVRTINIGPDLPGQDWVKMSDLVNGSMRFEATIGATEVRTRIDVGIDGTWDFTYVETGGAAIGAFTDLRVHSPVAANPAGAGGITVDNIRLEVVPEPSTYALLGLGAMAIGCMRRRK